MQTIVEQLAQEGFHTTIGAFRDGLYRARLWRKTYGPLNLPPGDPPSVTLVLILWCCCRDSNTGPTDYESVALPAELQQHAHAVDRPDRGGPRIIAQPAFNRQGPSS